MTAPTEPRPRLHPSHAWTAERVGRYWDYTCTRCWCMGNDTKAGLPCEKAEPKEAA